MRDCVEQNPIWDTGISKLFELLDYIKTIDGAEDFLGESTLAELGTDSPNWFARK